MRQVKNSNENVHIHGADEPGEGGACHEYFLSPAVTSADEIAGRFGNVRFQNGPVKENGVNGSTRRICWRLLLIGLNIFRPALLLARKMQSRWLISDWPFTAWNLEQGVE